MRRWKHITAMPLSNDWVTDTYLRRLRERLNCEVEFVESYVPPSDSEVYICDHTLVGLIDKTIAWAASAVVITYRDILLHSGKYHAFIGKKP